MRAACLRFSRGKLFKGGDRFGDGENVLRRVFSAVNRVHHQLDGLAGVGGHKDGRGQQAAANPGLPGSRQAVAAGIGQP